MALHINYDPKTWSWAHWKLVDRDDIVCLQPEVGEVIHPKGTTTPIPIGTYATDVDAGERWWCAACTKAVFGDTFPVDKPVCPNKNGKEVVIVMDSITETADDLMTQVVEKVSPAKPPRPLCYACHVPICEVCGVCEEEGCVFLGKRAVTATEAASFHYLMAKTQKIRGYIALAGVVEVPNPFNIILNDDDIQLSVEDFLRRKVTKGFIRPCPEFPRHGFVDSRPVDLSDPNIYENIKAVFTAARAADPNSELLLTREVESIYNLILTPTRMAIGAGNAGATSGHGSLSIPLMGAEFYSVNKFMGSNDPLEPIVRAAGIKPTDDPYIEVVVASDAKVMSEVTDPGVFFTQLRAGVKIPSHIGGDYIPDEITVTSIVPASDDLLEWEKQVKTLSRGAVVVHLGGTLISHYGVHCLYNNVPILTTRIPEVGETLHPTAKMVFPDLEAFSRGLAAGAVIPIEGGDEVSTHTYPKFPLLSCAGVVKFLLSIHHNSGVMGGDDGVWLGAATSLMMRVGMAASHGEARHADACRRGQEFRDIIYKASIQDFFGARRTLGKAQNRFMYYSGWGGSYGGKAWAKCTDSLITLDGEIKDFLANPTQDGIAEIVSQLNIAINQAHNGGWWLNKFVSQNVFTAASKQDIHTLSAAGAVAFEVDRFVRSATFNDDEVLALWRSEEPITVPTTPGVLPHDLGEDSDEPEEDAPTGPYREWKCVKCGKTWEGYDENDPGDTCYQLVPNPESASIECYGHITYTLGKVDESNPSPTPLTTGKLGKCEDCGKVWYAGGVDDIWNKCGSSTCGGSVVDIPLGKSNCLTCGCAFNAKLHNNGDHTGCEYYLDSKTFTSQEQACKGEYYLNGKNDVPFSEIPFQVKVVPTPIDAPDPGILTYDEIPF